MKNLLVIFFLFLICSSLTIPKRVSEQITNTPTFQISIRDVEVMRNAPSKTYSIYQKYRAYLQKELPTVNDEELYIIFCSIAAHSMAPYGACQVSELHEMLHSPYLHCGKYGLVMMGLAAQGYPTIEDVVQVHAVGWNYCLWGNHQTLFIHRSYDDGIFLDPTCGIVAFASFNEVASGKKIPIESIHNFGFRNDIDYFRPKVIESLTEGLCRPSHIGCYFHSVFDCKEWFENYFINPRRTPTPAMQELFIIEEGY